MPTAVRIILNACLTLAEYFLRVEPQKIHLFKKGRNFDFEELLPVVLKHDVLGPLSDEIADPAFTPIEAPYSRTDGILSSAMSAPERIFSRIMSLICK